MVERMKKQVIIKRLQFGLLVLFLILCSLSTIIFHDTVAPMITVDMLEQQDTTQLYSILFGVWSNVDPIPIFPALILNLKLFTIANFFFICIYSLFTLKGKAKIREFYYLISSGLIFFIHFVSFEKSSALIIFVRKVYISYYLGLVSFPLIGYYAIIISITLIMLLMLASELRHSDITQRL